MSAVGRLTAAIEKLEALKEAAPSGPWRWDDDFGDAGDTGKALTNDAGDEIIGAYNWHCCSFREEPIVADGAGDLIVTLHRTIDAQLAILRHALARAELKLAYGGLERASFDHTIADAVALADAILGGAS